MEFGASLAGLVENPGWRRELRGRLTKRGRRKEAPVNVEKEGADFPQKTAGTIVRRKRPLSKKIEYEKVRARDNDVILTKVMA